MDQSGPINTDDTQDEETGLGFDIERASVQEAQEVENTTGSKYEPLAEAWREAREDGEALILRGLEQSRVGNIRSFIYRAFDKESVIVRSKQSEGGLYNVTIRERQDGEFLQAEDTEDTDEETTEVTEDASDVVNDEETVQEENGEPQEDFPAFGGVQ